MFNKGTKSTFTSSSSSQQYRFQSATSSTSTSRTVTSGGVTSSRVNSSTSSSSTQHQGAIRRSSATTISNLPSATTRNERPYSSVRGPIGQSYSGSASGAVIGALGSFGGNRLERSTSSINRPSVTTLSPVPQRTTWDAKPYTGSSFRFVEFDIAYLNTITDMFWLITVLGVAVTIQLICSLLPCHRVVTLVRQPR